MNPPRDATRAHVRRAAVLAVTLIVLIGGVSLPAGSQSRFALREGLWVGESIASASLDGSAEGASATFDGTIGSQFTLFVDENGFVDGDWILDGTGIVLISGPTSGHLTQVYTGSGAFTGDHEGLGMSGTVVTDGSANVNGRTFTISQPNPFALSIELDQSDCVLLIGDWIFPLELLAAGGEWSTIDIHGFFYATYVGDEVDDPILKDIEQLWKDQDSWGDEIVDTGFVDPREVFELMARAQQLAVALVDANDCLYERTWPPGNYLIIFAAEMAVEMLSALIVRDFDGEALHSMSIALSAIGNAAGVEGDVGEQIQIQAQTIMDANMTSDGDTCDPCLAGDGLDVVLAALSGQNLGHSYDINGRTYSAERIIQAVEVVVATTSR